MKNMDVSTWTDEKLEKKKTSVKLSTNVLIIGIFSLFAIIAFIALREGQLSWTLILPVSFLPILLHNREWLKTINEEIEKRKV